MPGPCFSFFVFGFGFAFVFESGCHYIVLAGLEATVILPWRSNTGITGVYHHTHFNMVFICYLLESSANFLIEL
jgi:hypothetical protein